MKATALCVLSLSTGAAWAGAPASPVCRAAASLGRWQRDFSPDVPRLQATWEWELGGGQPASNTAGVVGLALVGASGCGELEPLRRYVRARVAQHEGWEFLYDADVEALASAAGVLGEPALLDVAREAFRRRYEGGTGEELVARWFWVRGKEPALVAFDAAQAIRTGLAVGEREKARELAEATLRARARWASGPFLTAARGALLEALELLGDERFRAAEEGLAQELVLTQGRDGSWDGHVTQATAYAVRGLSRWSDELAAPVVARGRRWLRATQLADGGWATFHDGLPPPFAGERIPEVSAEAMLAL